MNTSLSWIKMYVPDLDVTAQEYTDAMTLTGTKVEGFEKLDADLDKIVIGQIEKIEKHPDADKLIICQVNIGTETVQIVTGAPNVKEGDKVPVVLDGGRVAGGHDGKKTPGGIEIKKGKLRGIDSYGMMCSIEELGSTREMYPEAPEYGIYIFPEDAVVARVRSRHWAWMMLSLNMKSHPIVLTATAYWELQEKRQLRLMRNSVLLL